VFPDGPPTNRDELGMPKERDFSKIFPFFADVSWGYLPRGAPGLVPIDPAHVTLSSYWG
jgi:hypothetical protein